MTPPCKVPSGKAVNRHEALLTPNQVPPPSQATWASCPAGGTCGLITHNELSLTIDLTRYDRRASGWPPRVRRVAGSFPRRSKTRPFMLS